MYQLIDNKQGFCWYQPAIKRKTVSPRNILANDHRAVKRISALHFHVPHGLSFRTLVHGKKRVHIKKELP